jgi:peptidoglycan hydrolase-like protein with peptidoglycan-binding domain
MIMSAKYYIKNDVKYPTISKGSKNAAYVKLLQTELNNAGFNCGAVDGIYGVKTDKAARNYQKACGLVVDGIVGPKTWAALLNIHIVELNPMSLRASLVNGVSSNLTKLFPSFINANFFSGTKTIGWLASEGKIISERDNHKKWFGLYDKPKGTFIVFKDGSVEVGFKTDREMDAVRDKIYFCCQGFNLIPLDLGKEGFSMSEVGRVCNSVMMGWTGDKVIIAVRPGTDAYRAVRTMKELGCKSAIRLDSGGSANMFVAGKGIFKTNRTLTNVIYW